MDRHCLSYNKISTSRLARSKIRWLYLPRLTRIDRHYHSLPQQRARYALPNGIGQGLYYSVGSSGENIEPGSSRVRAMMSSHSCGWLGVS